MDRRLAAIFAADVAGYSRLIGADEEGTLERLKAHRRELIDPKIAEHRGRIVKTTGDGLLVEFASAVKAVRCAIEMQPGMADRNADAPEDSRIEFRIGINLGDVIVEDDDIYGDGVNIAARLEGIAEPGAIYISRAVRDFVRDKLEIVLEDLGEKPLKNIAKPVRVFRIAAPDRAAGAPQASAAAGAAQAVDRRAALRQHERRCRAGVFQRRHDRGPDHRPLEGLGPVRHRAQLLLRLQGQVGQGAGDRARPRRALRARGQHPQGRQSRAHHGAAHRCRQRRASLGRAVRSRSHRHLRDPGRGGGEDRRRAGGQADAGRGAAAAPTRHQQRGGLRSPGCARANCSLAARARRSRRPGRCTAGRSRSIRISPRRMPGWRSPRSRTTSATGRPIRRRRWTRRSDGRAARSSSTIRSR